MNPIAMGRVICLLAAALGAAGEAEAFEECGSLQNAYGPYDYRVDKDRLGIVEGAHFTAEVESLRSGRSGYIGGDIDYTLRAFPNHPRALMAMMRLGEREHAERLRGAHYSVRCYFERAVRFRPNDATARMIYGTYLARHGKNTEALEQLEAASGYAGDDANVHYNLGLVYFSLGKYDEALSHAQTAYRRGFPLPGLKDKLRQAGQWVEPPAAGAASGEPLPGMEEGTSTAGAGAGQTVR